MIASQVAFAQAPDRRISPYQTIKSGVKVLTVANSRDTLVTSSTPAMRTELCASSDNAGVIVYGDNQIEADSRFGKRGAEIAPGGVTSVDNTCVTLFHDDLYEIYVESTASADAVVFTYEY